MARKPRNLSDEERELWSKVASTTERLSRPTPLKAPQVATPPAVVKKPVVAKSTGFRIGEKGGKKPLKNDLTPSISDQVAGMSVSMDKKAFGKMKKGRLSPESRIDLHGMTIAQAQPILVRFILDAVAMDRRLVLVITGKGKNRDDGGPIPVRHGVLRHQVPHWLHMQPLKPHILQISEAHLKHGGQGAYYVYLRRRR